MGLSWELFIERRREHLPMHLMFADKDKHMVTPSTERESKGTEMQMRFKFKHCILSLSATTSGFSKCHFLSSA